jgi:hypothetical protein
MNTNILKCLFNVYLILVEIETLLFMISLQGSFALHIFIEFYFLCLFLKCFFMDFTFLLLTHNIQVFYKISSFMIFCQSNKIL